MNWTSAHTFELVQFQCWLHRHGCLRHLRASHLFYAFSTGKLIILRDREHTIEAR